MHPTSRILHFSWLQQNKCKIKPKLTSSQQLVFKYIQHIIETTETKMEGETSMQWKSV